MEKNEGKKKSFGAGPWTMKDKEFQKFIPVTSLNRSSVITLGRILYVIERVGRISIFRGTLTIDPCFTEGKWRYPWKPWQKKTGSNSHFSTYFEKGVDYDEWFNSNKAIIDKFINNGQLYINPSDPILVYFRD